MFAVTSRLFRPLRGVDKILKGNLVPTKEVKATQLAVDEIDDALIHIKDVLKGLKEQSPQTENVFALQSSIEHLQEALSHLSSPSPACPLSKNSSPR